MPKFNVINDDDSRNASREKFHHSLKRTITASELCKNGTLIPGVVAAVEGNYYGVKSGNDFEIIDCRRAGKIVTSNGRSQIIAIGDSVIIESTGENDELATIVAVNERKTRFSRLSIYGAKEDVIAANIDKVLITCAAQSPTYNKRMIDRMLISATVGGVTPGICINKVELSDVEELMEDLSAYTKMNIPVFLVSCYENLNIDELRKFLKATRTVLVGQSGVGKSSIINLLSRISRQNIAEVSRKTGKGRHTTSAALMVDLDSETSLIDTPGIREFGIVGLKREEISAYFPDFLPYNDKCRYIPCTHTHEPGCAIKSAVADGYIDPERYRSYLNIFDSLD